MFKDVMLFFRMTGTKGDIRIATARPLMTFKGTKLQAEDTKGGHGTTILGIYIDGQLVTPRLPWWRRLWFRLKFQSPGVPTSAFLSTNILGGGLGLPTCPMNKEIGIEIEFTEDCEWKADLYGRTTVLG